MNNSIKLGQATNLLRGLNSDWNPANGINDILYAPASQPLSATAVGMPDNLGSWAYPDISLHASAQDLLSALVPYRVVDPSSNVNAPGLPTGSLLMGAASNPAALQALSQTVGIDLSNPDFGYALVKLSRRDGMADHAAAASGILVHMRPKAPDASYGVSPAFYSAMVGLRHFGKSLNEQGTYALQDANDYLAFFKQWGTHFVSGVDTGDCIMQVFAYPSAQFKRVQKAYANQPEKLSGPDAAYFVQFTTDLNKGEYGYVKQYGNLLNLSNSAAFVESLNQGEWKDAVWSKNTSIFSIFNSGNKLNYSQLNDRFTDTTFTLVELSPLTVFVEYKRSLVWQSVCKAAFTQKYRDTIQSNFTIHDTRDFVKMLPLDQPGLVSSIATPTISTYKARIALDEMQFVAAESVKNFTILANVAQASGTVEVPGTAIGLYGQVMDMRQAGQPVVLKVKDDAYAALSIACDEFLGAMAVVNAGGSQYALVVDGLLYGLVGEGREANPVALRDVRQPIPANAIAGMIDSLQFALTFAEAVAGDQSGCGDEAIQGLVRDFLRWIADSMPATSSDPLVLNLRIRALDLSSFTTNPAFGSFVPILPFEAYERWIQKILAYLDEIQLQINQNQVAVALRKQAELTIDVGKTLNENIIQSGDLLAKMIDANAAQQSDLTSFYDGLIAQQKGEAAAQEAKVGRLEADLFAQQAVVDTEVQKYKSAVERWETEEWVKFGLDVATNLFSLGVMLATPASAIGAVKEMNQLAQMIQKTLNVLNASYKLYTGITGEISKLQGAEKALDGLDGGNFGDISPQSWDDVSINFSLVLATGPKGDGVDEAKARLDAAFKILVSRGKATSTAKSSLHQVQRDIYASQLQKELGQRQADRLKALKGTLKPANIKDLDVAKIDLVGLTGNLDFVRNQMLNMLAKAYLQQDLALQYQNLQAATPILSFSLLEFKGARVRQEETTIAALSALAQHGASTTTPIRYVIDGVAASDLSGGNTYSFSIGLGAKEFLQYVDARVLSLVAEIDGVADTDNGKVLVQLAINGSPFSDRDPNRGTRVFRTPTRDRVYQFNAQTGAPDFTDGGSSWSDGVSRVTPFSTWQISIPKTKLNHGVTFKQPTVKIVLSFVLHARIVDEAGLRKARAQRLGRGTMLLAAAPAASAIGALPSVEQLVQTMFNQGTVTNRWDVVFNMSLAQINGALKKQYDSLKVSTPYKNSIVVETKTKVVDGVWAIVRYNILYGYPGLTFYTNNDNTAKLEAQILEGSSVTKCIQVGTDAPKCDPATVIKGETLTANIKIGQVQGTITTPGGNHNVLTVQLDMKEGSFDVSNMNLSNEQLLDFNMAVKAYFAANPVIFIINQLDLTNIPTLEDLKPKGFYFKPLKTPSGNEMLQLYIQTGNRNLLDYSQTFLNNVPEPIPQGQECSLMLRSELFYNAVMPQSMKAQSWKMAGVNPGSEQKAWSGKFTEASVKGDVDLSPLNHSSTSSGQYGGSNTDYTYYIPGGNTINWSMAGTTLASLSDGRMWMSGTQSNKINFTQKACSTYWPCLFNCGPRCSESGLSTDVNMNVQANLPVAVEGTGRNQSIKIAMSNQAVTVTGHMSGGGPSGSDDLMAQVNQKIQQQIPAQIVKNMNVPFDAISVFALKNLLFPSDNVIKFEAAKVPGDLLIVGTFVTA